MGEFGLLWLVGREGCGEGIFFINGEFLLALEGIEKRS